MTDQNSKINLREYLADAKKNGFALGHFNFSTEDVSKAIVEAARDAGAPAVMVGTSEGEVDFVGIKEAVAMVKAVADDFKFPVFLNADHFKSFEKCREAIDAGYDAVLIDGSRLPFEENIALVKKVVEYVREISKYRNIEILVEGELGYLRGSSQVQEKVEISRDDFTKPEEAAEFVARTGVDSLAAVFGNIHGIVTGQEERLDIEYFEKIVAVVPKTFLVLHGASGLKDDDVKAAIKAGIVNVHFNTELRVAYREAIDKALHADPGEAAPYKYLAPAAEEVKKVVIEKIKLLGTKF